MHNNVFVFDGILQIWRGLKGTILVSTSKTYHAFELNYFQFLDNLAKQAEKELNLISNFH